MYSNGKRCGFRSNSVDFGKGSRRAEPGESLPVCADGETPVILVRMRKKEFERRAPASALGSVDPFVLRTARSIGTQQGENGRQHVAAPIRGPARSLGLRPEPLKVRLLVR